MTTVSHPMKLAEHVPAFAQVVLYHARDVLPAEELRKWREYSQRGLNIFTGQLFPPPTPDPELPLEDLLERAVGEPAANIQIWLDAAGGSAEPIGLVAGAPVYYFRRQGAYLWAPAGGTRYFLDFYLTWPAYPPGW